MTKQDNRKINFGKTNDELLYIIYQVIFGQIAWICKLNHIFATALSDKCDIYCFLSSRYITDGDVSNTSENDIQNYIMIFALTTYL